MGQIAMPPPQRLVHRCGALFKSAVGRALLLTAAALSLSDLLTAHCSTLAHCPSVTFLGPCCPASSSGPWATFVAGRAQQVLDRSLSASRSPVYLLGALVGRASRGRLLTTGPAVPGGNFIPAILTKNISSAWSAMAVLDIIDDFVDSSVFNEIHIRATFSRLVHRKVSFDDHCWASPVLERLVQRAKKATASGELDLSGIVNLMWAVAKLGKRLPELLEILEMLSEVALKRLPDMNSQHVANIIWASATLRRDAPALRHVVPRLVERLPSLAGQLKPQDVSNIVWAAATLKDDSSDPFRDVFPLLLEVAEDCFQRMTPQAMSNTIWSLARLDKDSPEATRVLQACASSATAIAGEMNGQEMANACQGLALCGVTDMAFLNAVAEQVVEKSFRWSSRSREFDLPEILLAFAKLGVYNEALLDTVATSLVPSLKGVGDVTICVRSLVFNARCKGGSRRRVG